MAYMLINQYITELRSRARASLPGRGASQPDCPPEIPALAPEQAAQEHRPPPPGQGPEGERPDTEEGKDQGNDQLQHREHLAHQAVEHGSGAVGDRQAAEAPAPGEIPGDGEQQPHAPADAKEPRPDQPSISPPKP